MFHTAFPICLLAGFVSVSASGDVLWTQPQVNSFGGLPSQDARNPGGLGWFCETADNFIAQDGWEISDLVFYGGYNSPQGEEGATQGFTIRFYTDLGGHPGTRVFEQDVFQYTESPYYTEPGLGFVGFVYQVSIQPTFTIVTGGAYWISVVAILDLGGGAPQSQWGWIESSTVTPRFAHHWFFDPGNFTERSNDVAYTLIGQSAPPCPGDVDGDGDVDLSDLTTLLANFGVSGSATPEQGDLDGDMDVDLSDLTVMLANFGAMCR